MTLIGLLVAALPLAACAVNDNSERLRAAIEVDGERYTSEAVKHCWQEPVYSLAQGTGHCDPYGLTLSFRLKDDRVVVVPFDACTAACTALYEPEKADSDRTDEQRVARAISERRVVDVTKYCLGLRRDRNERDPNPFGLSVQADGFIFDNAEKPTSAEAFQFEPRSPRFGIDGRYQGGAARVVYSIPSTLPKIISAEIQAVNSAGADTLDRDFRGVYSIKTMFSDSHANPNPLVNALDPLGIRLFERKAI